MSRKQQFKPFGWSRRGFLQAGMAAGAAGAFARSGLARAAGDVWFDYRENPTSPLILKPFEDALPNPGASVPKPVKWDPLAHDSLPNPMPHSVLPEDLGLPQPITYDIPLQVGQKSFTSSPVRCIDAFGRSTDPLTGAPYAPPPEASPVRDGNIPNAWVLPTTTIYGFNGAFPGARINAEYGKPVLIRFTNELDQAPVGTDRQNFGDPEWRFCTHLHNGHTAPESDGNPAYMGLRRGDTHGDGYGPGEYSDNLYLNYPPENDEREKQSFLWFHDHQHSHTGANVYKGMVGLFPIYDPLMDNGDERTGFRIPGVREDKLSPDGVPYFDVKYDIPLAFYDCVLDDGVAPHGDYHYNRTNNEYEHNNGVAYKETHPEWWGKLFFQHKPDKGFLGDIFTVNCTAFPVLQVERRKYRVRMLGASISRIYTLSLMRAAPGALKAAADMGLSNWNALGGFTGDLQGQWRLDQPYEPCMNMVQIATDGGLIRTPIDRTKIEIWPAKRREFIIDFTRWIDGTETKVNDELYLVNTCKMADGYKPDNFHDTSYIVPMMKIVIASEATVEDNSLIPTTLRDLKPMPFGQWRKLLDNRRIIELVHSGGGAPGNPEYEWQIKYSKMQNGRRYDVYDGPFNMDNLFTVPYGAYEVWEIKTAGGWSHPMHIHQDEHQVQRRNGVDRNNYMSKVEYWADDASREDVVAVGGRGSDSVIICKELRDTWGPYVAHCHQLAHEDHAMMFAWAIGAPPAGTYRNQEAVPKLGPSLEKRKFNIGM